MFLKKKKRLLEWQNTLLDKPCSKLITTEMDLIIITEAIIKNYFKITEDSLDLLTTTINPDIFFKRLDLFYKELEFISRIAPYVTSQKISPDFLTLAYNKKQSLIFNFLKGYFSSVLILWAASAIKGEFHAKNASLSTGLQTVNLSLKKDHLFSPSGVASSLA